MLVPMKNILNKCDFTVGFATLLVMSSAAIAGPVPEMDGDLIGQVGLLIAGVILVARSISKK